MNVYKHNKLLNMNNTQYLVSICVPVYGVEKYIERCAISLFEQTYQNIEYIFVDDCTPDKSVEILKSVIERYPTRKPYVRIIKHKKNRGLGSTRNTAVDAAKGKFLIHVDSDDWIDNNCVKICVEKQKEKNADIVNFNAIKHCRNYNTSLRHIEIENTKNLTLAILERETLFTIWGRLIRTSLYKENLISVKDGIDMGEDYQIIPELTYMSKKIDFVHDLLYHYNCQNQSSYCFSFSEEKEKQILTTMDILTEFFKDKNECFTYALNKGKIKVYSGLRINACRNNNKEYYLWINKKINQLDKKYQSCLSLPLRISLMIKNFHVLKLYLKIATYIKHKIKKQ